MQEVVSTRNIHPKHQSSDHCQQVRTSDSSQKQENMESQQDGICHQTHLQRGPCANILEGFSHPSAQLAVEAIRVEGEG